MRKNLGSYVVSKRTGRRVFIERQWKYDRWYFSADGWTTQATTRAEAIRLADGR